MLEKIAACRLDINQIEHIFNTDIQKLKNGPHDTFARHNPLSSRNIFEGSVVGAK